MGKLIEFAKVVGSQEPFTDQVSVVIPAFNAAGRIGRAIENIADQTLKPKEIIVVDDGSSDDTSGEASAALKAVDLAGFVVRLESNSGPSAARNTGWRMASSPWVQFLDDDDELHPKKLQWQTQALGCLSDDIAVVHSPWAIRMHDSTTLIECKPIIRGPSKPDKLASLLADKNFIHISSGLISRSWLEKVDGFDERHRLIEDVDLQFDLLQQVANF